MGRLIVTEFVSMDGVMEAPGGEEGYKHTAWTFEFPDEGQYQVKTKETDEAEVMLLGRVTYEGFAAATWQNTTILRSLDDVARLKGEIEGDILAHGSNTLVHGLLERDLVDVLRLMIFPVILGIGKRIFPDDLDDKIVFDLTDHRQYGSIVVHDYTRQRR